MRTPVALAASATRTVRGARRACQRPQQRLSTWVRDPEGARDEKSNSYAMLIFMLPVLLGAFGIGVDSARNLYIRTTIQNNLDLSVAGGAAAGVSSASNAASSGINLDARRADVVKATRMVYATNRQDGPALRRLRDATVPGTNLPMRWEEPAGEPRTTATKVTYQVREQSNNAFLQILDDRLKYQTYTLTSSAAINQNTQ